MKIRVLIILTIGFCIAGCISRPCDRIEAFRVPQSSPQCLSPEKGEKEVEALYYQVMDCQGNKVNKEIVPPWGPPIRRFVNPAIKNPVPYTAYFCCNVPMTMIKEAFILPLALPLGGTRIQDSTDDWIYCHHLRYSDIYEFIWPEDEPGGYVDYHNMDRYYTHDLKSPLTKEKK